MRLIVAGQVHNFSGSPEFISDKLKEECKKMAEEAIRSVCPLPKECVLFALHEFMKNTLHGQIPTVKVVWLPDGSLLLIGKDKVGDDQLDPAGCFGLATEMIESAVGRENYMLCRNGDTFESYLRIPASTSKV